MTQWLKQSTSVAIQFGPFVDKTDGVSLEVGLATAMDNVTTGIRISKNGGNIIARNATVTTTTYDEMGLYVVTLDTTDTGTLGTLKIIFEEAATCLPVWQDFMIVPANVWDSMFGADLLNTDPTSIDGSTTAASNLSKSALGIVPGACEGTPSTSVIQTDLAETTDDHYIGRVVVFTSGVAAGEASDITDYTGSTGTITITAVTTAPAAADTFVIV